jgi:hypothetical protein
MIFGNQMLGNSFTKTGTFSFADVYGAPVFVVSRWAYKQSVDISLDVSASLEMLRLRS